MRRRRKLFYEVTTMGRPHLCCASPGNRWYRWEGSFSRLPPGLSTCGTHRYGIRTLRQAMRVARGLRDRWPDSDVRILRWFHRRGQRRLQEFNLR